MVEKKLISKRRGTTLISKRGRALQRAFSEASLFLLTASSALAGSFLQQPLLVVWSVIATPLFG